MNYLTTAEVAELRGCTPRYVQQLAKSGKLRCETKATAANNRLEYIVPVSALSESEQIAWENRQRKAAGLKPIEKAAKNPPSTVRKQERRLTLDDLSEKQRNELYIWTSLITDWLRLRAEYAEEYGKCKVDEMFIAQVKLNPKYKDIEISTDILYRKLKAYKAADISGLIDKRGGSNKGSSCVPEFMLDAFLSMYLCQQQLPISRCYEYLKDWVAEHYPESVPDIPSERTFRRRADELPLAVKMYMREGDKAFADKCLPYIERLYDDLHANDVWIADNHTFDFFTAGADGKQRRLYLTAFTDAKSGVMVGWNLTYSPSSDSTLLALRHGILRCGVPKSIYVDNGSEFLVSDIGGRGHRRRKDWNKEDLPPNILSFLGIEMHNAIVRNAKAKPMSSKDVQMYNYIANISDEMKKHLDFDFASEWERLNDEIGDSVFTLDDFYKSLEDVLQNTEGIDVDDILPSLEEFKDRPDEYSKILMDWISYADYSIQLGLELDPTDVEEILSQFSPDKYNAQGFGSGNPTQTNTEQQTGETKLDIRLFLNEEEIDRDKVALRPYWTQNFNKTIVSNGKGG